MRAWREDAGCEEEKLAVACMAWGLLGDDRRACSQISYPLIHLCCRTACVMLLTVHVSSYSESSDAGQDSSAAGVVRKGI